MAANVAAGEAPPQEPHLPRLHRVGAVAAPTAPQDVASAGLEEGSLSDLAVKLAYTVARFTTNCVAQQLRLSLALVRDLLQKLAMDGLVEELWQSGQAGAHYRITD